MEKILTLPGVSCNACGGELILCIQTKRVEILELKIKCRQCDYAEDLLERSNEKFEGSKKELQRVAKEISKSIVKLRDTLPKNKEDLAEVVKNPRHPFTAALLSGLVILMLELSGFGVFMAVTWILGNLILNPVGWVLIPVVVAIAFAFRSYFSRNKLKGLKERLAGLEQQRDTGILTIDEYEASRDELLSEYFK
jgi:hypothetical protein